MKPHFETPRLDSSAGSLIAFERRGSSFPFNWHHHAEYELTWIGRGRGLRSTGDQREAYEAGDLVLLGSHLPHTWMSASDSKQNHAVVIQFSAACFPEGLLSLPEFREISLLLEGSRQGLSFDGKKPRSLIDGIRALPESGGFQAWQGLLAILSACAAHPKRRVLASPAYRNDRLQRVNSTLEKILHCIDGSFTRPLSLDDAAKRCALSPSAFSRSLKKLTGRTYVELRNSRRIERAEELLTGTRLPIAQVALEAGFENLPHFHRCFQRAEKMTPLAYRTLHERGPAGN